MDVLSSIFLTLSFFITRAKFFPETLIIEIAPFPGGEEHATMESEKKRVTISIEL